MTEIADTTTVTLLAAGAGYDPIEDRLRQNIRSTIEAVFEEELAALSGAAVMFATAGRSRATDPGASRGHRDRQLVGTFGSETVRVPRPRVADDAGKTTEWRAKALLRYQRPTKKAAGLIASVYWAGTSKAAGRAGVVRSVRGRGQQGRRQPGSAQGEGRLGRLVCAQFGRRGDRPADPGRHCHQDPIGPEIDEHLGARGHPTSFGRRASGRAESAAFHQEHRRRKQGGAAAVS